MVILGQEWSFHGHFISKWSFHVHFGSKMVFSLSFQVENGLFMVFIGRKWSFHGLYRSKMVFSWSFCVVSEAYLKNWCIRRITGKWPILPDASYSIKCITCSSWSNSNAYLVSIAFPVESSNISNMNLRWCIRRVAGGPFRLLNAYFSRKSAGTFSKTQIKSPIEPNKIQLPEVIIKMS